jgi:hypothetical protein
VDFAAGAVGLDPGTTKNNEAESFHPLPNFGDVHLVYLLSKFRNSVNEVDLPELG